MKHRIHRSTAALAAVLCLAAAQAASAEARVAVPYGDLDLAQAAGVATLHGRLRAAARTVCGAPEREELRALFARRDCYELAIARAIRELGAGGQLVADAG